MVNTIETFIRSLFITLLTGSLLLLEGCMPGNLEQQESQRLQLESEKQALARDKADVATRYSELKKKLALLETARKALDQEYKKLDVLKRSIKLTSASSTDPNSSTAHLHSKRLVLGAIESTYLRPPGITLAARIDTGAKTSSVNAQNITEFERDGRPYVTFHLKNPDGSGNIKITRRVIGHVKIKENSGTSKVRPVVKMRAVIGNINQRVEFTLADRREFKYQVLIGRNFLRDYAVVDVSQKYVTKPAIEQP